MSPAALAAVYSVLIALAALLGGWLPQLVRLTHTRMQMGLSFVAGVILGVGLLHLIPHGYIGLGRNIDDAMLAVIAGFLSMFFLQRFLQFHHHDAPAEVEQEFAAAQPPASPDCSASAASAHDEHHDVTHGHLEHLHLQAAAQPTHRHVPSDRALAHPGQRLTWSGAFFGLALHSLIDGLALAAAVRQGATPDGGSLVLVSLGTFLAVCLHKPFDSMSIITLMIAGGWPLAARRAVNAAYSLIAPLGVLLFFLGFSRLEDAFPLTLGAALCFAGGAFLCIAASDLLPEVQFHSHDRWRMSLSLMLGVALAWSIVLFEQQGHEHHAPSGSSPMPGDPHDHDHPHHHH